MCCHAYTVLKSVFDPRLDPSLPETETEAGPDAEAGPEAGPGPGPEREPENHVRGYLMAIRYALSHLVENANRSSGPLSPILEKYKHLIDPHLYKKVVEGQCWLMPPRTFKKRLFQWEVYILTVYIWVPNLIDEQRNKISCKFCNKSTHVQIKEYTEGRRVFADGQCYWFIGQRLRCRSCESHMKKCNKSEGDCELCRVLRKYISRLNRDGKGVSLTFRNYDQVIIKRNKWTHQMPCDLTHKMATDKNLTARCKDLSLSAEKFVKLFNELQHEG